MRIDAPTFDAAKAYTPAMLRQFDRLTERMSSRDQVVRIEARIDVQKFLEEHGQEVCNIMFAELKRRDREAGDD